MAFVHSIGKGYRLGASSDVTHYSINMLYDNGLLAFAERVVVCWAHLLGCRDWVSRHIRIIWNDMHALGKYST